MIKITIEGGEEIKSAIDDSIREAAQELIDKRLKEYRCPERQQSISSILSGDAQVHEDLPLKISACCDRAIADACEILGVHGG